MSEILGNRTTTITRKMEFDAGHRVLHHEGKCRHIHGHRYVAEVTVSAPALDRLGRVVDFSVIKTEVGGWIDKHWDHNLLLNSKDPIAQLMESPGCPLLDTNERRPYLMFPELGNPTAENIARELFLISQELLKKHDITVIRVCIWETPNCCAVYEETESAKDSESKAT